MSVVQLTFLKLLSATARQSFTYTCQNSAAWLDEAAGDHGRSARFLGANGEELSFNQTAAATIKVPSDGCRVRKRAGTGQIGGGMPVITPLPLTHTPSVSSRASSGRDSRRPSSSSAPPEWDFCPCWMWQLLTLARRTRSLGLNWALSALAAESFGGWEGQ